MTRFRFWPLGRATGERSGAIVSAYRFDGVPQADVWYADGPGRSVEELREIRDMLSAVIARLELAGAA